MQGIDVVFSVLNAISIKLNAGHGTTENCSLILNLVEFITIKFYAYLMYIVYFWAATLHIDFTFQV